MLAYLLLVIVVLYFTTVVLVLYLPLPKAALREANPVYAAWRDKGAIGPCEQREVRCGFD